MSTPDARLNAAERAALADLEAAATAADPTFADRLRGAPVSRALPLVLSARAHLVRAWTTVLHTGWWGVPMVLVGLLLAAVGLSSAIVLSLVGGLICAVGLRVLAEMVDGRAWRRRRSA